MKKRWKAGLIACGLVVVMASAAFAASDEAALGNRFSKGLGMTRMNSLFEKSGITLDEIKDLKDAGKTWQQIAEEKGLDLEGLLDEAYIKRSTGGKRVMIGGTTNMMELFLEKTGLTLEDLREFKAEGKTWEQIAAEYNIDLEALKEEMHQQMLQAIDEKVQAGDLTEEEAAQIKERMEERIENHSNFMGFDQKMKSRGMGFGKGMGFGSRGFKSSNE